MCIDTVDIQHITYTINTMYTMYVYNLLYIVFRSSGIDLSHPFIATCGSGITASLLAFAAYTCGQQHVAVYDVSQIT